MCRMSLGIILAAFSTLQITLAKFIKSEDNVMLTVSRQCDSHGDSMGELEWRSWRDGDNITARCYITPLVHTRRFKYVIAWTYENKKGVDLYRCVYEGNRKNGTELLCDYTIEKANITSPDNLLCWIRTVNAMASEKRTACVSGSIPTGLASYGVTEATPARPTTARAQTTQPATGDAEYREPVNVQESSTVTYSRYKVHVGPDVDKICPLKTDVSDDSPVNALWMFSVSSGMDGSGLTTLVLHCNITFLGRLPGLFTIYLRRSDIKRQDLKKISTFEHESEENNTLHNEVDNNPIHEGVIMKKCLRKQDIYKSLISCTLTSVVGESDLGGHAFTANIKYKMENDNNITQYCDTDQYITYHVVKDSATENPSNVGLIDESSRPRRMPPYRDTPHGESGLPWNAKPINGYGLKYDALRTYIIVMGMALFLLLCGCCCASSLQLFTTIVGFHSIKTIGVCSDARMFNCYAEEPGVCDCCCGVGYKSEEEKVLEKKWKGRKSKIALKKASRRYVVRHHADHVKFNIPINEGKE